MSVCLSVCLSQKPLSLSELFLSAIIPKSHYANQPPCPPPFSKYASKPSSVNHWAYQPSSLSTIKPNDHWANQPLSLLTIEPINHQAYQPSSLLTLALLSRLLCLLACWKYILSISKTRQNIEFQTSSPVSPNNLNIDLVNTSWAPCSISSLHCIVIEYHNHKHG